MSSGHQSGGRLRNLRIQKALGTEYLIFADIGGREVYIVDINSLNTDPNDPASVNNEINAKKTKVNVQVSNEIKLTETNGNDQVLGIGWTEEILQGNQYDLVLVAVTKQGNSYNFVKCPNASRTVNASAVPEIKVLIKNNEPKLVSILDQGAGSVIEGYGH